MGSWDPGSHIFYPTGKHKEVFDNDTISLEDVVWKKSTESIQDGTGS